MEKTENAHKRGWHRATLVVHLSICPLEILGVESAKENDEVSCSEDGVHCCRTCKSVGKNIPALTINEVDLTYNHLAFRGPHVPSMDGLLQLGKLKISNQLSGYFLGKK